MWLLVGARQTINAGSPTVYSAVPSDSLKFATGAVALRSVGQCLVGCGRAAVVCGSFSVAAGVEDVGGAPVGLSCQRRGPPGVRRGCGGGILRRVLSVSSGRDILGIGIQTALQLPQPFGERRRPDSGRGGAAMGGGTTSQGLTAAAGQVRRISVIGCSISIGHDVMLAPAGRAWQALLG